MHNDFDRIETVLVAGGAGYVGSRLVPQLLRQGYRVVVYDILFFGDDFLPKQHPHLTVVHGDIRDARAFGAACSGVDAVIDLACVSNDASFELDEELSTSINLDAFEPMVAAAKRAGVRRFVYASSSSVYGVSNAPEVREDHPLVPLTLYNRYKAECEPILFSFQDADFTCVTIRPATICGHAPRQRLDLSVNILTNHAVTNGEILVFGGSQQRPNLHIQDMCRLYAQLLREPRERIAGKTWNAGYQNHSMRDLAETVKRVVELKMPSHGGITISMHPSDDLRSYRINADLISEELDFAPQLTIEDAVRELCSAFGAGLLPRSMADDRYYNVRTLKKLHGVVPTTVGSAAA